MKPFFILIVLFALISCTKQKETPAVSEAIPEATSFSGKPLYAKPADSIALKKSDSVIAKILNQADLSENDFVEIGKQLVATNRYQQAVINYTEGLTKYPDSYILLRNRGHRYITLRQLDNSIADLLRAEKLMPAEGEVMEYGLDGKPTASVRHQIYYHIGVYNYLMKDYEKAAAAFEKALASSGDMKNVVGSSDWLYNCYQRLNQKEKAENVIKPITPDYLEDKDQPYFRRILLYKGIITPQELIDITMAPEKMSIQDVTKLYGLANWYRYQGNQDKANEYCKIILQSQGWPGFAYAAAEKDTN